MKPISVSNLTLDLDLDYVKPAAIAAGIVTEEHLWNPIWGDYTVYSTDDAAADEIAHCMYCACIGAGSDGIERTHDEYIRHEAERMLYQLDISMQYDTNHTAATIAPLRAALAAMLAPAHEPTEAPQEAPAADAEQQPTETENAPQAATQAAEGTDEKKEEDNTMSTTANDLQKYVDGIAADLRKLYEADPTDEEREAAEENGDACDLYSYFTDALDIEYTISSRGDYLGARIAVALGGPNIYIDTREGYVKGYWGTDRKEAWIPSEICEEIDSIMEEYYDMVR